MTPLEAVSFRGHRIGRKPATSSDAGAFRSRGPVRGLVARFLQSLLQALHESRSEQAQREIHDLRHLIPADATKTAERGCPEFELSRYCGTGLRNPCEC
jgi:hypothetical protein